MTSESADPVSQLPTPERLGLPSGAAVAVPVPEAGLAVYRRLRRPEPQPEDFEPTWTRPQAQLRRIPELFRTSISHWLLPEQASEVGDGTHRTVFVARVALEPDPLIRIALTEHLRADAEPGHVDVWAYPRQLLAAVVDVTQMQS